MKIKKKGTEAKKTLKRKLGVEKKEHDKKGNERKARASFFTHFNEIIIKKVEKMHYYD